MGKRRVIPEWEERLWAEVGRFNNRPLRVIGRKGDAIIRILKRRYGYTNQDIEQEAWVEWIRAAKAFDPSRGYGLSTLAATYIQRRLIAKVKHYRRKCRIRPAKTGFGIGMMDGLDSLDPDTTEPAPYYVGDDIALVRLGMQLLSPADRKLLQELHGLDGIPKMSNAKIGQQCGVSHTAIWYRSKEAVNRLKLAMQLVSEQQRGKSCSR